MKLNLLLANDEIFAGHVNIDAVGQSESKQKGDILNLDWIVEDNSCQEIRAIDIIDYVDMSQKENVLRHWISKLNKGGTITISGYDLYMVTRAIHKHELTFQEGSTILWGTPDGTSMFKGGLLAIAPLKEFLKATGIKVVSTKLNNNRYVIKGIKQ